jgi:oxygen-independent coproporphyrinogen III oxidase
MSGIYIHIPFCKKACHYCNFHFSTQLHLLDPIVDAICKDIQLRQDFLAHKKLSTIYFGGGTPSLLSAAHLDKIINTINICFDTTSVEEITIECNPDDLNKDNLKMYLTKGINRLSVGVQSFFDEDLTFMNRAHNANEAVQCLLLAKDLGFDNISIDLIYGSMTTTNDMWEQNLNKAIALDIPHISSYCLTVEEKTALHHMVKTKKVMPPDEEKASVQFEMLRSYLAHAGYDHYEISNFGKPGKWALHNTNYWRGTPYLGVGPSAHSYDGIKRSWCIANNSLYVKSHEQGTAYVEDEILTKDDQYNEYIMIGLRTIWGINTDELNSKFGTFYYNHFVALLDHVWVKPMLVLEGSKIILSKEGKLFADGVAAHFFV